MRKGGRGWEREGECMCEGGGEEERREEGGWRRMRVWKNAEVGM